MRDLSQFVDESKDITEEVQPQVRKSTRSNNYTPPITDVKLSWWQEQEIYDRMFDARIYRNKAIYYSSTHKTLTGGVR